MLTQSSAGGIYGQLNGCGDASHGIILRGIPANGTTSSFAVTAQDVMGFYEFGGDFRFFKKNGTLTELARIDSDGLKFNGDTLAANALDDYEEGTFTATAAPSTSGTITLSVNTCSYTKIGRQVTIKGQLVVGSVASPIGTLVTIAGLPFTSINSVSGRGSGTATYFPSVGSGSLALNYQLQNAAEWNLVLTAATIAAGDEFYITLTYFV
jgi:hypothetical protein